MMTPKTTTYRATLGNIRNDSEIIIDNPKPIELNRYIPENLINELIKLFGRDAQSWVNVLDRMVR